jgi:hypothetical protein
MKKSLILFSLVLLLAACGRNDEAEVVADSAEAPPPEVTEPAPFEAGELAGADGEALREALNDPEQRAALIQSLRERRGRMSDDERMASREVMRERMRERRAELADGVDEEGRRERLQQRQMLGAAEWWNEAGMAEALALEPDQQLTLSDAHAEIEADRGQLRETLATTQRELMQAVQTGDRARIEALLEQRSQSQQASLELESRWQRQLLATLDDDQLRQLATRNPQLLMGRARTP